MAKGGGSVKLNNPIHQHIIKSPNNSNKSATVTSHQQPKGKGGGSVKLNNPIHQHIIKSPNNSNKSATVTSHQQPKGKGGGSVKLNNPTHGHTNNQRQKAEDGETGGRTTVEIVSSGQAESIPSPRRQAGV
jgi:hypothetical protein